MSTAIKLSPETKDLLKVASSINNSIEITAGNSIKTVAESGAIIMESEVSETFPETFRIYELNRFLSVLGLDSLKDADLIFDNQNFVDIRKDKTSVKYKFTTSQFTTHPGKAVKMPTEDLIVDLTSDTLKELQRMASILGHKVLEFRVASGKAFLTTTSPDIGDASSDSLIELADVPNAADGSYKILFSNLILPNGDYTVTVSAGRLAKFAHKNGKTTVYIGLERV